LSVSVLILTLNEEQNLPSCLASVAWCDDIVVLDSFSTDRTAELAEASGARVIQRRFDNWSTHQNWAVQNINFKHSWVFYLDADERCDDQLRKEVLAISEADQNVSAFRIRRKDYFWDRWLKHAQLYPTWLVRIFRPEKICYERLVNPVAIVNGITNRLEGHLIHYPFSHGIAHWYTRHNNYSTMEAQDLMREVRIKTDWLGLVRSDRLKQRKIIKQLLYKLPCRPVIMLFYLLFIRGAFLDGIPGIYYSFMRTSYEFMIDLKVIELQRQNQDQSS
jgi:glycosyltransferase involved in cell wall biosynthesis